MAFNLAGLIFSLFKPAPPSGSVNLPVQVDVNGPNTTVSISAPLATTSVPGLAQADGTSISVSAGVISTASGAANLVLATPNGSSGASSLRALVVADLPASAQVGDAGLVIDGGGALPSTGFKGFRRMAYAGTITGFVFLANGVGSAQITVSKATYAAFPTITSIVASAPPTLSSAQKNTSTTLTGWTLTFSAGDILWFNLDSVSGSITWMTLDLQVTRS